MDIEFKQTVKIFGVLFGVLVFGMLLGISLVRIGYVPMGESKSPSAQVEQAEIRVELTIDYGNGDTQIFSQEVLGNGDSVLDLLEKLERVDGITLQKRNFPGLGVFVEAIHGVHNTNTSYWQFWVNGEYARVGAGQYELKDGDEVLWKRASEKVE